MAPKKEKKIFFDSSDSLESVLKKLEDSAAEKIVLNVPGDSPLADSMDNFHLIKEKARILKKEVIVESVNDHILEFASLAQLTAVNPVFRTRERAFSDIVMTKPKRKRVVEPKAEETGEEKPEREKKEVEEPDEDDRKIEKVMSAIQATKRPEQKNVHVRYEKRKERDHAVNKGKRFALIAAILVLLLGGGFAAVYLLPSASVALTMKRVEKNFSETVFISIDETSPQIDNGQIVLPGEVLSASKNTQVEITAQGKEQVNEKARGKLTIYNAFDKNPQTLVATTRFESPDGKIFRLVKEVKVPGMRSENGKDVPGQIDADVVADQPGEAYNIPPTKNWKIPGFKGSARYEKFTAENVSPMAGGFSGERPKANDADKAAGEAKLKTALEQALEAQMNILLSEKFTLIPGATYFAVTKTQIQSDAARPEAAILYGEAEMRKMVFMEEMLKTALVKRFAEDLPEKARVETLSASYGEPRINWSSGTMEVQITGKASFVPDLDSGKIIEDIKGKGEGDLKQYVFALPGIDNAKVSLWPFWVKDVPRNPDRIDVSIK